MTCHRELAAQATLAAARVCRIGVVELICVVGPLGRRNLLEVAFPAVHVVTARCFALACLCGG